MWYVYIIRSATFFEKYLKSHSGRAFARKRLTCGGPLCPATFALFYAHSTRFPRMCQIGLRRPKKISRHYPRTDAGGKIVR